MDKPLIRCPHCGRVGQSYYISGSGTASHVNGCKACGKRFRTQIKRPEPPLHWDNVKEPEVSAGFGSYRKLPTRSD